MLVMLMFVMGRFDNFHNHFRSRLADDNFDFHWRTSVRKIAAEKHEDNRDYKHVHELKRARHHLFGYLPVFVFAWLGFFGC